MKKYLLTASSWTGEIEIEFNDFNLLTKCDTGRAELSEPQQVWFLKNMPRTRIELQELIAKTTTATLTEVKEDITFDLFWNRYNEKVRSSKKKTLKVWNRLGIADQVKAYKYIGKYEQSIAPGVGKKYAETYLNAELWNN